MIHLDEYVLNEYLDAALTVTEAQAVERHLATCQECQATLAELQDVFTALAAVSEVPLTIDLTAFILAESQLPSIWWSRWLMAVQAITAVILLILLWPMAELWLTTANDLIEEATVRLERMPELWERVMAWGTAVWEQAPPTSPLELPTEQWLWLIGLALLTWLVGNGLLLNLKRRQTIT